MRAFVVGDLKTAVFTSHAGPRSDVHKQNISPAGEWERNRFFRKTISRRQRGQSDSAGSLIPRLLTSGEELWKFGCKMCER